ncbi:hypothetical protein Q6348_09875 [Isoptericola sp. b441]|uniref:DUF559 domain-containing protein n=1 Tax=Actinotalea lenta TaxID=3064654 RepID=A0ABT9DDL0_9CELL|nr:hypothetical protein [Isoptericola sp. b441]MDO8107501.1 hypothetical protein [Isoptericola sp. b441]
MDAPADRGRRAPEARGPDSCGPGGRELYRLDAGYPELRLGFEYDGEEWHRGAQIAADEARRDDLLHRFGWTVVAATREKVLGARPAIERVVADLIGWAGPVARREW